MKLQDEYDYKLLHARFPKIALGVEIRWGTRDLQPYIHELLQDTRGHTRMGFPVEVATSLTNLSFIHSRYYPDLDKPPDSVWDINYHN